jgi:hypothetical protein
MPFERWSTGEELFQNLDREHDLLDRDLRPFLEACDQLQGLQIFSSTDDAWGGFTARYLERISDELGKGTRWVFGLKNGSPAPRDRQMVQTANYAQSTYALHDHASLHVPLSVLQTAMPFYVSLNHSSHWHTSALEAVMVESVTLPTRLRGTEPSHATYNYLETTLNNDGNRHIVASGLSIKDPDEMEVRANGTAPRDTRMMNGIDEEDEDHEESKLDIELFPSIASGNRTSGRYTRRRTHTFSEIESLRGLWEDAEDMELANDRSRDRFASGPRLSKHQSNILFPILSSYPRIFRFGTPFDSIAVDAKLAASTQVADGIRDLERSARLLLPVDESEAICDGLTSMAEEYEEGWSSGDDDDDND